VPCVLCKIFVSLHIPHLKIVGPLVCSCLGCCSVGTKRTKKNKIRHKDRGVASTILSNLLGLSHLVGSHTPMFTGGSTVWVFQLFRTSDLGILNLLIHWRLPLIEFMQQFALLCRFIWFDWDLVVGSDHFVIVFALTFMQLNSKFLCLFSVI
jgi:hypothetical protein